MADAAQVFGITVPANTSNFQTSEYQLPLCTVERILITWPPGCAGLVQVIIQAGGNFAYPSVSGQAFEFDDYTLDIMCTNPLNSGSWAVMVNNTDVIAHSIHVTFMYNYWTGNAGEASAQPVSI